MQRKLRRIEEDGARASHVVGVEGQLTPNTKVLQTRRDAPCVEFLCQMTQR